MNLPEWHNVGIEPPQEFKDNGWTPGVKPPAQYMNWWMNSSYLAIKALQENKADNTKLTTLQTQVTEHLDDYSTTPTTFALATPVGFIGNIIYSKGANNLVELFISITSNSQITYTLLGTLPVGFRSNIDKATAIDLLDVNGNYSTNGSIEVLANGEIYCSARIPKPEAVSIYGFKIQFYATGV